MEIGNWKLKWNLENSSKVATAGAGSVVVSIFAVVNVIIGAMVR